MRFNHLNRRAHYWATVLIALPILVVTCTGILLQVKKQWSWVQPQEQRGTGTPTGFDLETVLTAARTVPGLERVAWDDVSRVDVRPARGAAKAILQNGWEVQVELGTGRVLQAAYRRSDVIESLHDGSFFAGNITKLGLFLPCAVGLLMMWVTGIWMFAQPLLIRRARGKRPAGLSAAMRPAVTSGEGVFAGTISASRTAAPTRPG